MTNAKWRWAVVALALVVVAGCATGRAIRTAQQAARQGDWDTAVAYYRQALARDPGRVDVKVALERAMRNASAEHLKRARDLEAQDQLAGAVAEYRLAADLDPGNTLAVTKARELEKRIRDQAEAARPRPSIEDLRQQAAQASPVPRLDPRTRVPLIRFQNTSIRDILTQIGAVTGINITYEQTTLAQLERAYSIEVQDMPVEDVLNQIMSANKLTFKVINPKTIFVYADTPQNRQAYEDQYIQVFYLSHMDPQEAAQQLGQLLATPGISATRPTIQQFKSSNAILVKASDPVMRAIDRILRSIDKPRAEVMIEAEILEVDRNFLRELGVDLNRWALGFTFSPEVAPPNTSGTFPPANAPPFNLNTISAGVSAADFYISTPAALVRLLEQNQKTRVLARSQLRGKEGTQLALKLGDDIPVPQTTFQSLAAGGIATTPTTQVTYRSVGVNLIFTPRVTFQDEIILDGLTVEKSGLGAFLEVAGQSFPTFVSRRADSALRLRDGESNLLAGLLQEEDRRTYRTFPGLTSFPILRSLFGATDAQIDQTDLIMVITPRIIRTHELTAEDLKPMYVGTGTSFGAGTAPTLISPDAPLPPPAAPPPAPAAAQPPPAQPPAGQVAAPPPAGLGPPPQTVAKPPGVVPVEPVTGVTPPPPQAGQIVVTAPGAQLEVGAPPYTVPITISGVSQVGIVSLTVTYDPAVLRAVNVSQGTYMQQGAVTPTFVPKIDAAAGRIDIAIARPADRPGASGPGLLAAITFEAVRSGSSPINVSGVVTGTTGQPIQVRMGPANVVVK